MSSELVANVLIRLGIAFSIATASVYCTKQPRLTAGLLTGATLSSLTLSLSLPALDASRLPISHVVAAVLSIVSFNVGLAFGTLLPVPLPGTCLGVSLSVLLGAIDRSDHFAFELQCAVLAAGGTVLSCYFRETILYASSVFVGGGAFALLLSPSKFAQTFCVVGNGYTASNVSVGQQMLSWIGFSLVLLLFVGYKNNFKALIRSWWRGDTYASIPPLPSYPTSVSHVGEEVGSAGSGGMDVFNMFDPTDLPPRLAEYAVMVYTSCEDLGNFFGFQDASVRNQAEHILILLSNHRRQMTMGPVMLQPPSPIHALHKKIFENYKKWCKHVGVRPCFAKMSPMCTTGPPAVVSRVVDLVLYFCIWGEGGNLRHMPEVCWFLYHKMMESYVRNEGITHTRCLYAGHFLDHVVTPIYKIVCKSMKSSTDHQEKRNYDDYNEFFWSPNCLRYSYSTSADDADALESGMSSNRAPHETLPPIAQGLAGAPKSFLEKRSWFRGILALKRVIEWHVVTFFLLAVISFSRQLIWSTVYTCQVASGVFWVFNLLHLIWELLEVWVVYPGIDLSATAVCGFILTIGARFLILSYQSMYLLWTYGNPGGYTIGVDGDSIFWWWQYIWLSLLSMTPYIITGLMQAWPATTSWFYTNNNDYLQSFMNILFPLSRLYVGKEVHSSFRETCIYLFFWATLIVWKLYFSYIFEVNVMVLPTLQITDDYVNFPGQSFYKMLSLLILRWLPQFLVYSIDMSIWYSLWQAFAGTWVGFSERLGDVRDMDDIRNNFVRAPEYFCHKMLSPDAGSRRGSEASFFVDPEDRPGGAERAITSRRSFLGSGSDRLQTYVNRLLDVRIQKWVMFSEAWNEIIRHFRLEDIVSDRERDYLMFSRFEGFSQAVYLPAFQTAGVVENALNEMERPMENDLTDDAEVFKCILTNTIMRTAVSETWELGNFILVHLMGKVHQNDIVGVSNMFLKWSADGTLSQHINIQKLRSVMNNLTALTKILEKGLSRRKPVDKSTVNETRPSPTPIPVTTDGKVRRSSSFSSFTGMGSPPAPTDFTFQGSRVFETQRVKKVQDVVLLDAMRDQVKDKTRALLISIKTLMDAAGGVESADVSDRITFMLNMENGFFWNDEYASDQLDMASKDTTLIQVIKKVHGLIACHPDDVEPKSREARRRLTFFVNSLFMDMPEAPSIQDMMSWNVMTPFYSEDVTYSKGDLEKRTDALGVSTLLYLQTLYKNDWANFLERLKITDDTKIWSKKYIEETRIWASIRAQTLSRTVSGMMYYEKALRLLANLERLDEDTTNDLLGEKFGYIVACQVYGNMKKNQDSKADDIEKLMHRFPHMRVAYIDNVKHGRSAAPTFYSVLVKSDGAGSIQEVFRVRLAGNPVLGEGKPENQNHAIIFSRGETIQTIDMNQEGYFEEALKMRNALQEFPHHRGPLPMTILGLREHIFTGSVSSLANYMALQETSFVTLGQRVLAKPLCIRLHYGHPDVFDKLFFMTRGGISKSSKGINLSEDIFAGYNNVVRGGAVGFKEYIQVGKGRDVGMSQIYKFEAKLSQGAAEQSLSRDIYRIGHRLDFCRLFSLYFGGIGHYFSNVLTVLTIYVVSYLLVILAVYDIEKIGERVITPQGTIQMLLGGLGLLQTFPLFATLGVERGWWASAVEIFQVFATGGPLHFMFHIQTKAFYMAQTIFVGGAKYRATGRGFVTQHTPFDEQYRFFAASHLYLGAELGAALFLMGVFTQAGQYFGRTWSLWLASLSFLASPFWFNPLTFEWNCVMTDYLNYIRWMRGNTGGPSKSWDMWWTDENSYFKKLKFGAKLFFTCKSVVYVVMAIGIYQSNIFEQDNSLMQPPIQLNHVFIFLAILLVVSWCYTQNQRTMSYPTRRTLGILITVGIFLAVGTIVIENTNVIRYLISAYYGLGALCMIGLLYGIKFVKHFYFIHDLVIGHILFFFLFVLAALQFPRAAQTWGLYHNALSTDVVVSDILRHARKNQQSAGNDVGGGSESEQITELKKLLARHETVLQQITRGGGGTAGSEVAGATMQRNESTDAIASLIAPSSNLKITHQQDSKEDAMKGRVKSMSGLDVWGDMALGERSGEQMGLTAASNVPTSYAPTSSIKGFSFSQPDVMPPR